MQKQHFRNSHAIKTIKLAGEEPMTLLRYLVKTSSTVVLQNHYCDEECVGNNFVVSNYSEFIIVIICEFVLPTFDHASEMHYLF